MKKFEYRTLEFNEFGNMDMDKRLTALGDAGWELVSVCPTSAREGDLLHFTAFFKREIEK